MSPLQKTIGATRTERGAFSLGTGTTLPGVWQDLAAQRCVAPDTDRFWRDRRSGFLGRGAGVVLLARGRYSGAGLVVAGLCVCDLAGNLCVAGQLPIEMR